MRCEFRHGRAWCVKLDTDSCSRCVKLLPVPNLRCEFKSTYLRSPKELGDNIADLSVSAKVLFFREKIIKKYFRSSEKINFLNGDMWVEHQTEIVSQFETNHVRIISTHGVPHQTRLMCTPRYTSQLNVAWAPPEDGSYQVYRSRGEFQLSEGRAGASRVRTGGDPCSARRDWQQTSSCTAFGIGLILISFFTL